VRGRLGAACATALLAALAAPASAVAHGISQRADLPIPEWLFGWAAAVVLVVSFAALGTLWRDPKLEPVRWRPVPGRLGELLSSKRGDMLGGSVGLLLVGAVLRAGPLSGLGPDLVFWPALVVVAIAFGALVPRAGEVLCGAIGAGLLLLVIFTGLVGEQTASANLAPTFVYVAFWVGLVPLSVLFGDVFRLFNPWRAIGRAVSWAATAAARQPMPAPLAYPERLGRWPAVAGLLCFTWLELASQDRAVPRTVAFAVFAYSAVTFLGMALYGVRAWIDRGEAFSAYFNLFARLSPWERRDGVLGVRKPLAGLTSTPLLPSTTALAAVMIGTVTFDGASQGPLWQVVGPAVARSAQSVGMAPGVAVEIASTAGIALAVLLVYGLYLLGVTGARLVTGERSTARLARSFAHSLVPIALVYAAAHYFTLLVFQGQALAYLVSDPFGTGADLFGTADRAVDYTVLGAATIWYVQVAMVLVGHIAALMLAHDRALVLFPDTRTAVRSQYWMLGVMVAFTSLALWLLAQANT
jgi:hypothetical protein